MDDNCQVVTFSFENPLEEGIEPFLESFQLTCTNLIEFQETQGWVLAEDSPIAILLERTGGKPWGVVPNPYLYHARYLFDAKMITDGKCAAGLRPVFETGEPIETLANLRATLIFEPKKAIKLTVIPGGKTEVLH